LALHFICGRGQDSTVQQLTTGWTVPGLNLVGARFSALIQTGPGMHPASYTIGTGSFLGGKRPGLGINYPPHLTGPKAHPASYTMGTRSFPG